MSKKTTRTRSKKRPSKDEQYRESMQLLAARLRSANAKLRKIIAANTEDHQDDEEKEGILPRGFIGYPQVQRILSNVGWVADYTDELIEFLHEFFVETNLCDYHRLVVPQVGHDASSYNQKDMAKADMLE